MKIEFSQQILAKYTNTKFHVNPSSGSRAVPCGQADGRTDRQKWRSYGSLFAVLRTRLKTESRIAAILATTFYKNIALPQLRNFPMSVTLHHIRAARKWR